MNDSATSSGRPTGSLGALIQALAEVVETFTSLSETEYAMIAEAILSSEWLASYVQAERDEERARVAVDHQDKETLGAIVFRMAEDITRIKRVCTQEHPPKMGSPTREWTAGTETRHGDGTRCVLLNDGAYAVVEAGSHE